MVTVPLYITIMCSTTRILMSQITFEKFLQLASSQSVRCQISTFFVWLEPRVLRLWEQWMEHKVEQNLNKTSATDLRGSEPDPEWFGFFSLLPKSLRGEFPVCAANQRANILTANVIISTFCGSGLTTSEYWARGRYQVTVSLFSNFLI